MKTSAPLALALNHLLRQQPRAQTRAATQAGKTLAFEAGPLVLRLLVKTDGLLEAAPDHVSIDTRISWSLPSVLLVMADPQAVAAKAQVQGDAELAQCVAYLAKILRWDTEDDLARLVGDQSAVHIMRLWRSVAHTANNNTTRTVQTLREYVLYEQPLLVEQSRYDAFCKDIKVLRDDAARLEKRLQYLEKYLKPLENRLA